jgi:hypothetical protein
MVRILALEAPVLLAAAAVENGIVRIEDIAIGAVDTIPQALQTSLPTWE